jgi:hypothetical protein
MNPDQLAELKADHATAPLQYLFQSHPDQLFPFHPSVSQIQTRAARLKLSSSVNDQNGEKDFVINDALGEQFVSGTCQCVGRERTLRLRKKCPSAIEGIAGL